MDKTVRTSSPPRFKTKNQGLNFSKMALFPKTASRIEFTELETIIDQLSEKEREILKQDLHGNDEWKSMEEMVRLQVVHRILSLVELRKVLNDMDPDETKIYRQALQQCPMYVTSESFLLCFLRAEDFHIENAAKRLVRYWNEKYELFGEDHTFGPITLKSLQSNDLNVIQNGGFAILPKDEHGRIVIHRDHLASQIKLHGSDSVLRAFLYLVHVAIADDIHAQRRGMVILSAPREDYNHTFHLEYPEDIEFLQKFFSILEFSLPIRTVSYHIVGAFMTDDYKSMVMPFIHSLMGSHMSIRHRIHNGTTALDIQTSLSEYGITKLPAFLGGDNIPCYTDGTNWLKERRNLEERNYMHLPISKSNSNLSGANFKPHVDDNSMDASFTSVFLY